MAGVLLTAIMTSACSGAGDDSANYVALDPTETAIANTSSAGSTAQTEATATPEPLSLGSFTEDQVLDAINAFVDLRDEVVVGDAAVAGLEPLAGPAVLAQVEAERTTNLAKIASFDVTGRVSYTTFPYLIDAELVDDTLAAVTCSERWGERSTGDYQIVFMDQAMMFRVDGDDLTLTEIRTAHDGERATEGLTCFVGIMGERAVDATRAGVEALEAINADPTLAATADFAGLFSAVAYDSFSPISDTADLNRRRVTPVEIRYTPMGIDPSRGIDFIGVVSVCRHYPQGVYDELIDSGQRVAVNDSYGPGTSVEDLVYVHIEPKRRDEGGVDRFWDFEPNVSEGCWE